MTDYGVRLADGMVAPAASEQLASDSARLLRRPLCVLLSGGWRRVALRLPSSWSPCLPAPGPGCSQPCYRTVRRHQRQGERLCRPCRTFERERLREHYRRNKSAAGASPRTRPLDQEGWS